MSLTDLPATGTPNFNAVVRAVFDEWQAAIEASAAADHTHGAGGTVLSLVAAYANLGTGATDGELKVTADTGLVYAWDDTNSAWKLVSGVRHANFTQADSPVTLTREHCSGLTVITNRGATGDLIGTLPAGFIGAAIRAIVMTDTEKITLTAQAGETIGDGTHTSVDAGSVYIEDYGAAIELHWDETASNWLIVNPNGIYYLETT